MITKEGVECFSEEYKAKRKPGEENVYLCAL